MISSRAHFGLVPRSLSEIISFQPSLVWWWEKWFIIIALFSAFERFLEREINKKYDKRKASVGKEKREEINFLNH